METTKLSYSDLTEMRYIISHEVKTNGLFSAIFKLKDFAATTTNPAVARVAALKLIERYTPDFAMDTTPFKF